MVRKEEATGKAVWSATAVPRSVAGAREGAVAGPAGAGSGAPRPHPLSMQCNHSYLVRWVWMRGCCSGCAVRRFHQCHKAPRPRRWGPLDHTTSTHSAAPLLRFSNGISGQRACRHAGCTRRAWLPAPAQPVLDQTQRGQVVCRCASGGGKHKARVGLAWSRLATTIWRVVVRCSSRSMAAPGRCAARLRGGAGGHQHRCCGAITATSVSVPTS